MIKTLAEIKYFFVLLMVLSLPAILLAQDSNAKRVMYNHPGLEVDLKVGLWAWPLPMDYDEDGDHDLVVACPDKPYNGIYFFENTSGNVKMPVFEPPVRVGEGQRYICPSYVDSQTRVLRPGREFVDFRKNNFSKEKEIYPQENIHHQDIRANQWQYVDYDNDGVLDLAVGVGDWEEYGWDNAYNEYGEWQRGPLHGYVYLLKNKGSNSQPDYDSAEKILAGESPIDVYGMPSPSFADFDGDGDLDLICGEFLDSFTYFENIGSRSEPDYAPGRKLGYQGVEIKMDLEMIVPVALDWDKDGDPDLVVGQEDGRVAFMENTGTVSYRMPQFLPPRFFKQKAHELNFGALATPFSYDWDHDGDEDLICGNTAGYIGFIENLDGGDPPSWAEPVYLEADDEIIRIQAGPNGSIQGPCEAKWGYTTLSVADWNNDELPDIMVNSIWGQILWYENIGTRSEPALAAARTIQVQWQNEPQKPPWNWWSPFANNLATQWRTTPVMFDINNDELMDLVVLDYQGYLAWFQRTGSPQESMVLSPQRIFRGAGPSHFSRKNNQPGNTEAGELRLNLSDAGSSGRRKWCFTDWNGDGKLDLMVNTRNINFMPNVATNEQEYVYRDAGPVTDRLLAGHTTSPTMVDWDGNGLPDLLIGAEDGFFYYVKNPRAGTR